jgi:predicted metalloprotease with PDZ domain
MIGKRPKNARSYGTMMLLAGVANLACAARASTEPSWPLPKSVVPPPAIAAPRDVAYPGTIRLRVDTTDVARGIHRIHETVPVKGAQHLTLLYPQWIPGDPVPPNALDQLAGLVVTAAGKTLKWQRDVAEPAAFHVDVPAGAGAVDLDFQFLVPADERIGPVLATLTMLDLQWQSHVLYPAGYYVRRITIDPTVVLPKDWKFASALKDARRSGDVVSFAPTSLDALVDSPLMAARWMKQYTLSEDPVPVHLDVAADDAAGVVVPNEAVDLYRREVAQAYKLFGGRHYQHYDLMVWLSDDFGPSYFEQRQSGENALPADFFTNRQRYARSWGVPFHGFVHSWNGMFRVPAPMWSANFNTPPQDALLWVFEGLTVYWNDVLNARSGIISLPASLASWERTASDFSTRPGMQWRTLQDASDEVLIQHGNAIIYPDGRLQSWPDWQLGVIDAYSQGELVWLDIDTLIRERSGGRKSLDDFARGFFGTRDGSLVAQQYTFDDLVAGLNAVLPFDWAKFLRARVDSVADGADLDGITRGGYRLTWTDQPSEQQQVTERRDGTVDLRFSLGATFDKEGAVTAVVWGSPAWRAGLVAYAKVVSVNGAAFDGGALRTAVANTRDGGKLDLQVARGATTQILSVEWTGGLRYPHLERIAGSAPLLDDILAPRD